MGEVEDVWFTLEPLCLVCGNELGLQGAYNGFVELKCSCVRRIVVRDEILRVLDMFTTSAEKTALLNGRVNVVRDEYGKIDSSRTVEAVVSYVRDAPVETAKMVEWFRAIKVVERA